MPLLAPGRAPFSAGQGCTSTLVPARACDCHVHVYDASYPAVSGARLTPDDACVADYRQVQRRTGTERAVFVTPSTYGTDNRPMLAGLAEFGDQGRGVAVIGHDISDHALDALHAAGVRGVRLNLSLGVGTDAGQIQPLAARIAGAGWHLQLLASPDLLFSLKDTLRQLPVPLVLDHFARLRPSMVDRHPAHALVLSLLGEGRAWVKLSGGYIVTEQGPPDYGDLQDLAQSYLQAAPGRVLWGSDWPHASATAGHQALPDDARQMDLLASWAHDAGTLQRVLVDNPAELYGFSSTSDGMR